MAKLTASEVQQRMHELEGWTLDGEAIWRQFTFPGFPDAMAFVLRLAFEAETADHHPEIAVSYKRVRLTYTTHSAGGLTGKDFEGATQADSLAGRMNGR